MSRDDDADSKTEEASEKRIAEAISKGNNPVSRDAITIAGFFAFLLGMAFIAEPNGKHLFGSLALILGNASAIPISNGADASQYLRYVALEMGRFLGPMIAIVAIGGIAASFAQNSPSVVFERIFPDIQRLSPRKGWKRIFGLSGLGEAAKSGIKIMIMMGAATLSFVADRKIIDDLLETELSFAPKIILQVVIHLTSIVCTAGALLAASDVAWSRMKWRRDLRMSREELKEEHKESEGDPLVKGRMRSLALARSRKRMMASVPKATMIIANPTHYAIALRYIKGEGSAPLVVAKGQDLLALSIREIGERCSIPVLERRDLVRAMYDIVEVNKLIPVEFYRPIAEIIHFLNSREQRVRRR